MTDLETPIPRGTSYKSNSLREAESANVDNLLAWVLRLIPDDVRPDFTDNVLANLKACIRVAYTHYELFDAEFYRDNYLRGTPEDRSDIDPYEHYLEEGRYRGFSPNPYFDADQYLRHNTDISSISIDPCLHYMFYGWKEHRTSGTAFDAHGYLEGNPDVKAAGSVPFQHFMLHGRAEGRTPNGKSKLFNELDARLGENVSPDKLSLGTLVFVSHDAEFGRAQDALRSIGQWVHQNTAYSVRFVTLKNGPSLPEFEEIAPTLALQSDDGSEVSLDLLETLCGPDLRGVILNSAQSVPVLEYFPKDLPCLAYIIEHSAALRASEADATLIKDRVKKIIVESEAIGVALCDQLGIPEERLQILQVVEQEGERTPNTQAGTRATSPGWADQTGPQIFALIQRAANLKPSVSVIVPNYNYADYLPQRLASIEAQSFQDFEVILLDDSSTDGSVAILENWARARPNTRVIVNEANSGSPFKQWIKGMELAQSDLIWIAEADDFCGPDLLSTLVSSFADRNTSLAYAKSVPVNAKGEVQGDYQALYLNRISEGRWSAPYDVTDHQEANLGLGIANCIPNASAVMLRKFTPEPEFEARVTSMRMCGDWYFYLHAMRGGRVSYCDAASNCHRRHPRTVTAQTEGSSLYFDELQTVRDYVQDTYSLGSATMARIERFVTQDLDRFEVTDPADRAAILTRATRTKPGKHLPSVLFVVSDLSPGGGQMLAVRMANAWAAMGGRALLANVAYLPSHPEVVSQISSRVAFIPDLGQGDAGLNTICANYDVDIIHSSMWWADAYVATHGIEDVPHMPWLTTMHGCHESILENPQIDHRFHDLMGYMRQRMDAWVPVAEKNMRIFDRVGMPDHVTRIPNGVPVNLPRSLTREELGLRESAVVLCLASRAIETKGWAAAAQMVQSLNSEGLSVDLILLRIIKTYEDLKELDLPHVHLYGHRGNIQDYMAACDIGILPSFFVGESMPLVLLELMALGKPIVATDAGEIPFLVADGDAPCGLIVPLVNAGQLDATAFRHALKALIADPDRRSQFGAAAKHRYETRFTIEHMMESYRQVYEDVLRRRARDKTAS